MKGGDNLSMPPELREQVEQMPPEKRSTLEQVWQLLGRLSDDAPEIPGTEAAWAEVQQRLGAGADAATKRNRRPAAGRDRLRLRSRRLVRMALVLGACVLVFGIWWQQPVTVHVPRGVQRIVVLPDGSSIQLNSDSRLQHRRGFQAWPLLAARQRAVSLEGEAFFEVVRGTRSFVVETFNARVEVLGTQFNVRARSGSREGETRVTLASGQVRVTAPANQTYEALLTTAGEVARVGDEVDAAPLPAVSLDRALAWRQQGFTVVDQPLAFVLAEVERRYALTVAVEEGIALDTLMTLFYPNGAKPERIIHDICLEQGCRYRETSGGFALVQAVPASTR